jgi:hypothetical protein
MERVLSAISRCTASGRFWDPALEQRRLNSRLQLATRVRGPCRIFSPDDDLHSRSEALSRTSSITSLAFANHRQPPPGSCNKAPPIAETSCLSGISEVATTVTSSRCGPIPDGICIKPKGRCASTHFRPRARYTDLRYRTDRRAPIGALVYALSKVFLTTTTAGFPTLASRRPTTYKHLA